MLAATAPPMPPPIAAPFDEEDLATAVAEGVIVEVLEGVDDVDDVDVADDADEVGTKPVVCARIVGEPVAEAPTPVRTTLLVC